MSQTAEHIHAVDVDSARPSRTTHRATAVIVGVLFIIATAFLFIGEAIYQPILESPDVLDRASPDRTMAVAGILFEFTCVMAILLIPVFLYPILKRQNEALALGYTGFRFLEVVVFLALEVNLLTLIGVSESHLAAGSDVGGSQQLVDTIWSQNEWAFFPYVIVFALGAIMLYTMLFQSRLIPQWLSGWGLASAVFILIGTVLAMLDVLPTTAVDFEWIWAVPIAIQEMVMAVWLIVKGFDRTALDALPADQH